MKYIHILFIAIIICFSACKKSDDSISELPTETKVIVDGTSFSPDENIALKTGDGLVITLRGEEKSITIKANDYISGTYDIIPQSGKTSLFATITYKDANNTYKGTAGSFIIVKIEGNLISGLYNAKLTSEEGNSINIEEGSFAKIRTVSLIATESAINDTLLLCYLKMKEYVELAYVFDAVYSNTIPAPSGVWTEIYNHTQSQSPENEKIVDLWEKAYKIIRMTNLIIESSEQQISGESVRNSIIGQAKAIRAYLFYNLLSWFGEIPLENELSDTLLFRSTLTEVFTQIKEDAAIANNLLPQSWTGADDFRIPKSFLSGLNARINLTDFRVPVTWPTPPGYPFSFSEAISSSLQIINSSSYTLSNQSNRFTGSDPEIIWGFEKSNNTEFNSVFTKGTNIPVLRLTEVYLIMAEALYRSGNMNDAVTYINQLNLRNGNQPVSSLMSDDIFQHCNAELSHEGSSFVTLRRFDKAMALVNNRLERLLLPVPHSAIISNPYLTQNIGY